MSPEERSDDRPLLDQALPQDIGDGLGAVPGGELPEDVADMRLDRAFRDDEAGGDLLVRPTLGDLRQDVEFARGEPPGLRALSPPPLPGQAPQALHQLAGDLGVEEGATVA